MPPRLDDAKREAILVDIRAGGRPTRAIAQRHDVSDWTVRKVARDAGIDDAFSREQTKKATRARQADLAAQRAEVSALLVRRAREALDQMTRPHVVFAFGGKENVYNEHLLDRPPTGDMRNLMTIAGIAMQRHLDIERHDSDPGLDAAKTALGHLWSTLVNEPAPTDADG